VSTAKYYRVNTSYLKHFKKLATHAWTAAWLIEFHLTSHWVTCIINKKISDVILFQFTLPGNKSPWMQTSVERKLSKDCLYCKTFTVNQNNVNVVPQLYISLITSQLMYCSQIWRTLLIRQGHTYPGTCATKSYQIYYVLNDYTSSAINQDCNNYWNLLPLMYIDWQNVSD